MRDDVLKAVRDAVKAMEFLERPESLEFIEKSAITIVECFKRGGKLLIAGNGGSLCDAMHFAEELTGFFRGKRAPLPAIALADAGHISCTANDAGYEYVFARSIQALGKKEDIFIALTTSGNSLNLLHGLEIAKEHGLQTIAFLGKEGGKMQGKADLEWIVKGFQYSDRVQEAHKCAFHIIIEMIEKRLNLA